MVVWASVNCHVTSISASCCGTRVWDRLRSDTVGVESTILTDAEERAVELKSTLFVAVTRTSYLRK